MVSWYKMFSIILINHLEVGGEYISFDARNILKSVWDAKHDAKMKGRG